MAEGGQVVHVGHHFVAPDVSGQVGSRDHRLGVALVTTCPGSELMGRRATRPVRQTKDAGRAARHHVSGWQVKATGRHGGNRLGGNSYKRNGDGWLGPSPFREFCVTGAAWLGTAPTRVAGLAGSAWLVASPVVLLRFWVCDRAPAMTVGAVKESVR